MIDNTILQSPEYAFLHQKPELGPNIILLGFSGSIAYGTNNENSDIDVRGVALNPISDLIGLSRFDQYVDDHTDTVIYGFNRFIQLLIDGNPSSIELLGLNQEHYLYLNDIGKQLIQNAPLFFSKKIIQTFRNYADAQLRKLQNALARDSYPQIQKETHILQSLKHAITHFNERYLPIEKDDLHVYLSDAVHPEFEKEVYIDVALHHYPLRDYKNMLRDLESIVRSYDKLGNRNKKKDDNHLNKHAMHLVRLLLMGLDIIKKNIIRTYRGDNLPLLLDIRHGKYQNEDGSFKSEFFDIVNQFEREIDDAAKICTFPDTPDLEAIEKYVMDINGRIVRHEI